MDECAADTQKTLCPAANNVVCNNTVGTYECHCANPKYYKKESDKKCVGRSFSIENNWEEPKPATALSKEIIDFLKWQQQKMSNL